MPSLARLQSLLKSSREKEKAFGWLLLIWQHRLLYSATKKMLVSNCAKEKVSDGLMLLSQYFATSLLRNNRISCVLKTRKGDTVGCCCSDTNATSPPL